jgi:hypothetical protein
MPLSSAEIEVTAGFPVKPLAPTRAHIFRSAADLNRLSDLVQPLLRGRDTLDPRFYLASITSAWIPRVIVISSDDSIVGVVCAKERKIAGIPTGIIHIDTTLSNILADDSMSAERVFENAIRRLLVAPGVRGLRLFIPPGGTEQRAIQAVVESTPLDECYRKVDYHLLLRLPPSFDFFLRKLGAHTRRNFRYYRRRFEAAGGQYVEEMTLAEFRVAAFQLLAKDVVGADLAGSNRSLRMLSAVNRPLLAGLRRDGKWVGILGGWYESNRATVHLQMNNDRDFPHDSLCTVLRSYVIESLVAKNMRGLVFWAGVGPPLSHHAEPVPAILASLDRPGFCWRTCRRVIRRINARLPVPVRDIAGWIAPRASCDSGSDVF